MDISVHPSSLTTIELSAPYLLFVGDVSDPLDAKTAFGIMDWAGDRVKGQVRTSQNALDLGLRNLSWVAAADLGVRSVIIGAAPVGGVLPSRWIDDLEAAAKAGFDIVSGLHTSLLSIPRLATAAKIGKSRLVDVRVPPSDLPVGTGKKRSGKRLLTVGIDCAIGKKYSALALHQELLSRDVDCTFRATGQTGIMIAGRGIPIDSVVADFISGAAEVLSPIADDNHWDVIEGQGSLFHPGYAGVALGLLHGSQPDALVLCCDPRRIEIDGYPGFPVPDIATAIQRNLDAARLTNSQVEVVGICMNTKGFDDDVANNLIHEYSRRYDLPVADPIRTGVTAIVDRLLAS